MFAMTWRACVNKSTTQNGHCVCLETIHNFLNSRYRYIFEEQHKSRSRTCIIMGDMYNRCTITNNRAFKNGWTIFSSLFIFYNTVFGKASILGKTHRRFLPLARTQAETRNSPKKFASNIRLFSQLYCKSCSEWDHMAPAICRRLFGAKLYWRWATRVRENNDWRERK